MTAGNQHQADVTHLLDDPCFRRFLWRVIDLAGIMRSAYGTDGRNLAYSEGRRSLGTDILAMVDEGHPLHRPDALGTWLAALSEEERTPQENQRGRRSTRTSDRDSDDGGDADD